MGEGAETPGRAEDQPDAPEPASEPGAAGPGPARALADAPPGQPAPPELVRPYVARHAHQFAPRIAPSVDLRQVWADEFGDPGATIGELSPVIDVTVAEDQGGQPDDGDHRGRGLGRTLAIAGAAVVVLVAIAGTVWAVGDRSGPDEVVLVVETTAGPYVTSPRTAPPASPTPPASAAASTTGSPSRSVSAGRSPTPPSSPSPASTTQAATTTTTAPAPTTQPPPATAKTGTVYATAIQPSRCVDVRSANTAPGTAVQGYDCNGTAAQWVTFTTTGTMQILGRCVQPQSGSAGALVVINECVGGSAGQQWRVSSGAVRHLSSGLCLALPNADPANWVQLRLETCNGSTGQRWTTPL
jgi:hypothetical protein